LSNTLFSSQISMELRIILRAVSQSTRHGEDAAVSSSSLQYGYNFSGFHGSSESAIQLQCLLQFGSGKVFITIFVVGHPQVITGHRVIGHSGGTLLEQTDSLRIYFLFVIDPAQRVCNLCTIDSLLSRLVGERESFVKISTMFGVVPCELIYRLSISRINLHHLLIVFICLFVLLMP